MEPAEDWYRGDAAGADFFQQPVRRRTLIMYFEGSARGR